MIHQHLTSKGKPRRRARPRIRLRTYQEMVLAAEAVFNDLRDLPDCSYPLPLPPNAPPGTQPQMAPARIRPPERAALELNALRTMLAIHEREDRRANEEEKKAFERQIQELRELAMRLTEALEHRQSPVGPMVH